LISPPLAASNTLPVMSMTLSVLTSRPPKPAMNERILGRFRAG
jgi:hypothetical protein